jgi:hypothetical protein
VLTYTVQCPYTDSYVAEYVAIANQLGIPIQTIKFDSKTAAQNATSPVTTFSIFYNGKFITHELMSGDKFKTLINKISN